MPTNGAERLAVTEKIWREQFAGRKPTPLELSVIEQAHKIGQGDPGRDGSPAAIDNYTPAQLAAKTRALVNGLEAAGKTLGYDRAKAKLLADHLIRSGAAGDPPPRRIPPNPYANPANGPSGPAGVGQGSGQVPIRGGVFPPRYMMGKAEPPRPPPPVQINNPYGPSRPGTMFAKTGQDKAPLIMAERFAVNASRTDVSAETIKSNYVRQLTEAYDKIPVSSSLRRRFYALDQEQKARFLSVYRETVNRFGEDGVSPANLKSAFEEFERTLNDPKSIAAFRAEVKTFDDRMRRSP
jgi:hypothetical protein